MPSDFYKKLLAKWQLQGEELRSGGRPVAWAEDEDAFGREGGGRAWGPAQKHLAISLASFAPKQENQVLKKLEEEGGAQAVCSSCGTATAVSHSISLERPLVPSLV